jgi:hypothetical protein
MRFQQQHMPLLPESPLTRVVRLDDAIVEKPP